MISGLSHTDDNYRIALESLHERYADPIQRSEVPLQKFFNLPSPSHNAKELHKFLTEYCKIREQMQHIQDFHSSNLVIRSAVLRKLPCQTYSEISDHLKNHNFNLQEMDSTLQYMIRKMEHGHLIMGDKANVNAVGAHSHSQSSKGVTSSVHIVQAITKQWTATSINLFKLVKIASLHKDCFSIA